jgi:hypothetical protein
MKPERQSNQVKPIPLNAETEPVARRVVWFEPPEEALDDPVRFMAYAMAYATPGDMDAIRRYVDDPDFLEPLEKAPPGIMSPRSWVCWNLKMGRCPVPPMPTRHLE